MKILSITAQKPNSTGSGVYLTELVKEYADKGYEQAVVAGVYKEDAIELPDGVSFYPVYFGSEALPFPIAGMSDEMPYSSTRYCDMTEDMAEDFLREFLKVIAHAVENLTPDLILCHHLYLLTAAVRKRFPEYRIYGFCHNTDLRQMRKTKLKREFIREQIKLLDFIFVPQRAQEEWVREIYRADAEKIKRLGMGYNSAVFKEYGIKPKDGVIRMVFAGKIAEKKGVVSLLKCLTLLQCEKDDLELYLAGSTGNMAEYDRIRALAEKSPFPVKFLGRLTQTELAKVYNQCDIFVLPSFFEGIPLTAIEALACGCRVVMTDLPGIREWLLSAAPGADVRYVRLPKLRNTDEPVPEELPEFEKRLADTLEASIRQTKTNAADVSGISWKRIAEEILKEQEVYSMKKISGNKLLVKALKEEGVDTIFGYPGACTIDISDELYKQEYTKVILPRQEVALVHEADAYARSTGKTGVCLVTSGPGATNLVTGLATAYYDSVPLVCFTGQVARHLIGNDAFQEVDIVGITRSITKYGVVVKRREDLGRIVKEAFYIARSGRPGPVLIDLPKDVMAELGSPEYPTEVNIRGYKPSKGVHIGQLKRALKMLSKAKRPLFLAGGGVNIAHANEAFTKLVNITQVPVVTTVMGRGAISTKHPLYIGNLGMHGAYACNMAVNECDLLFSIGTRFNDRITGKLHSFAPHAQIVHIDIDTAAISKNVQVDVPIVADAKEAIEKMLEYVEEYNTRKWIDQIGSWKEEHPLTMKKKPVMTPQDVITAINEMFEECILVTDVGQHQMFTAQFAEITEKKKLLMSGGLGTMGYGLPGAIGAKIGNPDTPVISVSGDGGMQMNIQELATAVLEELPIISCIFNNNNLGMVRQWQKLFYGKRYSMTCLRSGAACRGKCGEAECPSYTPDFVKLAESYGAKGIRVTKREEIQAAFEEAKKNTKAPTIIEFEIDPEDLVYPMIQPGGTLEDMIIDC